MKIHIQQFLVWLFAAIGLLAKPEFRFQAVTDHPASDSIIPGTIYVVGGPGYRKWAYFRCPSKTDKIVQLALMPNRRPRWEVTTDWLGRPTLNPSVRQLEGSFAHFWIRKGRVEWCADTGTRPMWPAGQARR